MSSCVPKTDATPAAGCRRRPPATSTPAPPRRPRSARPSRPPSPPPPRRRGERQVRRGPLDAGSDSTGTQSTTGAATGTATANGAKTPPATASLPKAAGSRCRAQGASPHAQGPRAAVLEPQVARRPARPQGAQEGRPLPRRASSSTPRRSRSSRATAAITRGADVEQSRPSWSSTASCKRRDARRLRRHDRDRPGRSSTRCALERQLINDPYLRTRRRGLLRPPRDARCRGRHRRSAQDAARSAAPVDRLDALRDHATRPPAPAPPCTASSSSWRRRGCDAGVDAARSCARSASSRARRSRRGRRSPTRDAAAARQALDARSAARPASCGRRTA